MKDPDAMRRDRKNDPEKHRRWARLAQRRRRAKLFAGRARFYTCACNLCLQFGHRAKYCPTSSNP